MKPKKISVLSIVIIVFFLSLNTAALAEPSIAGFSGAFNHKGSVVIGGIGFGTKSPAAPLWWDDCEGATINNQSVLISAPISHVVSYLSSGNKSYTEVQPTTGQSATECMMYRSSWHSLSQPHSHSSTYLAGGHIGGVAQGIGTLCYVVVSPRATFQQLFISMRLQLHPEWDDVTAAGTANYKEFWLEDGDPPDYTVKSNDVSYWSECDNWPWNSSDTNACMQAHLFSSDLDAHNATGQWVQRELFYDATNDYHAYRSLDGSDVRVQSCSSCFTGEDGKAVVSIGSYGVYDNSQPQSTDARMRRYFDDIYVDTTFSRVVLANNATYASATIVEPQIPSAWSNSSIECTVNLGTFPNSGTAYLFVFDSNNNHNPVGYPVTIGGGGGGDSSAPYTSGHFPAKDAVGFYRYSNIIVHLQDSGDGVDQFSIAMTVNGQTVSPTITGTSSDYTLTYNPPYSLEGDVVVTLNARDLHNPPNVMPQETYTFTVNRLRFVE